jgi:hypothetical protein
MTTLASQLGVVPTDFEYIALSSVLNQGLSGTHMFSICM